MRTSGDSVYIGITPLGLLMFLLGSVSKRLARLELEPLFRTNWVLLALVAGPAEQLLKVLVAVLSFRCDTMLLMRVRWPADLVRSRNIEILR